MASQCIVPNCSGKSDSSTRWCPAHYQRFIRHGAVRAHIPVRRKNRLSLKSPLEREALAYIAGFIDGEGSIGIHKRTRNGGRSIDWVPNVSVVNTHRPVMELIALSLGGTVRTRDHKRLGRKTIYTLSWSHRKARAIAAALLPYLKVKAAHAAVVAAFPAASGTFAPEVAQAKKQRQQELYEQMRVLREPRHR